MNQNMLIGRSMQSRREMAFRTARYGGASRETYRRVQQKKEVEAR
jgi:hypothetical protein